MIRNDSLNRKLLEKLGHVLEHSETPSCMFTLVIVF